MTKVVHLIKNILLIVSSRARRMSVASLTCLVVMPALARAHGMSGEEVGPPLVTSGVLGFVSYWVVMLWPSSKRKLDSGMGGDRQSGYSPPTERRSPGNSARVKRAPRLRKIEGSGRFLDRQTARRKANDG